MTAAINQLRCSIDLTPLMRDDECMTTNYCFDARFIADIDADPRFIAAMRSRYDDDAIDAFTMNIINEYNSIMPRSNDDDEIAAYERALNDQLFTPLRARIIDQIAPASTTPISLLELITSAIELINKMINDEIDYDSDLNPELLADDLNRAIIASPNHSLLLLARMTYDALIDATDRFI